MKENTETEAKIKQAFTNAVPDILDSVLSDCGTQKGRVIVMTENKKKNYRTRAAVGAAAALAVLLTGAAGFRVYGDNYKVASTVSLDVNPSIEIEANQKERVLAVNTLNEDARTVVGDMDFAGSSLDVTVNALIGSMLRNGYLSEAANSVLISVDAGDREKGTEIREKLTQKVQAQLETDSFSGAVLSQTVAADEELKRLAEQYGITPGKAQLIRQLMEKDSRYTFEDLSALPINALNLLLEPSADGTEQIVAVGAASDKAYIGGDKAKDIALNHAGIKASEASGIMAELDFEDGAMVYEVDFRAGGYEYDYDIDAVTGAVRKGEREPDSADKTQGGAGNGGTTVSGGNGGAAADSPGGSGSGADHGAAGGNGAGNSAAYIGEEKARQAALSHAGISGDAAGGLKAELDYEDGRPVYEVEFKSGGHEYSYDIDAVTGEIRKDKKESDDDVKGPGAAGTGASGIDEAAAGKTALSHAGISGDAAGGLKAELDYEDGRQVYEVEFKSGGYEYSYKIDAQTGAVVSSGREEDSGDKEDGAPAAQGQEDGAAGGNKGAVMSQADGEGNSRDQDDDDDNDDKDREIDHKRDTAVETGGKAAKETDDDDGDEDDIDEDDIDEDDGDEDD